MKNNKNFKYFMLNLILLGVIFCIILNPLNLYCLKYKFQGKLKLSSETCIPVCERYASQKFPKICRDGNGGAIITWFDSRSSITNSDVYAQRVDSNGIIQWDLEGIAICTEVGDQIEPIICSDEYGGAIIVWRDYRGADPLIYAQRINSNGETLWAPNGVYICPQGFQYGFPEICSDGTGGAIITWGNKSNGIDWDIFAQRVDSNGVLYWTPEGVDICVRIEDQVSPSICSDDSGGAIITWLDEINGSDFVYNIFAQRIDLNGDIKWRYNGIKICERPGSQGGTRICSDGVGGAIIAWVDARDFDIPMGIYAQRVDTNGETRWARDGIKVHAPSYYSPYYLDICSDGAEGAYITWQVSIYDTLQNISIQKVDLNGGLQWSLEGLSICEANDDQIYPKICSDSDGGAYITWMDFRNELDWDIYAQWVDSNGILQWLDNGKALCITNEDQKFPQICIDSNGGAFITWEDYRNYNTNQEDIYAYHIESPLSDEDNICIIIIIIIIIVIVIIFLSILGIILRRRKT